MDHNAKVVRFQHQEVRLKRKHKASSSYDSESSTSSSVDYATSPKDIAAATNAELQYLRNENTELRNNLESLSYNMSAFEGNDDKVLLVNGLQKWSILQSLYNYLCSYIPEKRILTQFQLLIFVLMRLRLNISTVFLAYIFNISVPTASRYITDVVSIMFIRMQPLIIWPEREQLQKTMPMQFRKSFGTKCAVLINCFEIFIDCTSNLKARTETWSSYKHHNTIKFLIGIAPQGTVSYISRAWGGRVTDKYIAENCGILDKINPGDVLLADRGFSIQESVACTMAQVKMPAFTKGKASCPQLILRQHDKVLMC